jgi:hypothetical protein
MEIMVVDNVEIHKNTNPKEHGVGLNQSTNH